MNLIQRMIAGGLTSAFALTFLVQATQVHAAANTSALGAFALHDAQDMRTLSACPNDHDHGDGSYCLGDAASMHPQHASCTADTMQSGKHDGNHSAAKQAQRTNGSHQTGGHHGRINE